MSTPYMGYQQGTYQAQPGFDTQNSLYTQQPSQPTYQVQENSYNAYAPDNQPPTNSAQLQSYQNAKSNFQSYGQAQGDSNKPYLNKALAANKNSQPIQSTPDLMETLQKIQASGVIQSGYTNEPKQGGAYHAPQGNQGYQGAGQSYFSQEYAQQPYQAQPNLPTYQPQEYPQGAQSQYPPANPALQNPSVAQPHQNPYAQTYGAQYNQNQNNMNYSSAGFDYSRQEDKIDDSQPTNTLFIDGLPASVTKREISHIFRHFEGFQEVRIVKRESAKREGRKITLGFAEFETPQQAQLSLSKLSGYILDLEEETPFYLRLSFSKKPSSNRQQGGGSYGPMRSNSRRHDDGTRNRNRSRSREDRRDRPLGRNNDRPYDRNRDRDRRDGSQSRSENGGRGNRGRGRSFQNRPGQQLQRQNDFRRDNNNWGQNGFQLNMDAQQQDQII